MPHLSNYPYEITAVFTQITQKELSLALTAIGADVVVTGTIRAISCRSLPANRPIGLPIASQPVNLPLVLPICKP